MSSIDISRFNARTARAEPVRAYGKICEVVGLTILATGPGMNIGDVCHVKSRDGGDLIPLEVVGFRDGYSVLMPLGELHGIGPGMPISPTHRRRSVSVGNALLGRVINALGEPIDGGPPLLCSDVVPLMSSPPAPLKRTRIREPLSTGVRAIDSCITSGRGQRMGILSGSGVGKSKLIGMISRNTNADVNVIALIGERGREVREFVEGDLGPDGLSRSVVVVATSDEPALRRLNGAFVATAIAEWFREQSKDVMLIMDSVTRFAMAQREVGLAVGEPPTTKGYPPSVYALLPRLLERAGTSERGSITGFYSVLVEADDLNDPVGDAVRSIVDGHIALARDLASRGHYPAIDVLESVSRSMTDVTSEQHQTLAMGVRQVLATHRDAEDLINIGAYVPGSNPDIDRAIRLMPGVQQFLRQGLFEQGDFGQIVPQMAQCLSE